MVGEDHILGNLELEEVILTVTGSIHGDVRKSLSESNVRVGIAIPATKVEVLSALNVAVWIGRFIEFGNSEVTDEGHIGRDAWQEDAQLIVLTLPEKSLAT